MNSLNRSLRLQSWIPPSFAWTTAADVYCIEVPIDDPDIVEFISTGELIAAVYRAKEPAQMLATGGAWLRGQIGTTLRASAKIKHGWQRGEASTEVIVYCHGVFLLPDAKNLCVLFCIARPMGAGAWITATLKAEADALLLDHKSKIAQFKVDDSQRQLKSTKFYERHKDKDLRAIQGYEQIMSAMQEMHKRPVLLADSLLHVLPRAVMFAQRYSGDPDKIARLAIAAVAGSGLSPSRDGTYGGILLYPANRKMQAVISWVPHTGLPSYPEVRWALQRRLPAALSKPRTQKPGSPTKLDSDAQLVEDSVQVRGFDMNSTALREALEDLQLDNRDFSDRVDNVRKDAKVHGFEAIAWFQPYHVWSEESWGVYFDAQKLDDLACSFLDDFKTYRINGSHCLAALLAFGLAYSHELFHARVEAALSWQEVNALQPRHLRYKQRVYDVLYATPGCLEEALANWYAWDWFHADATQNVITQMKLNKQHLDSIVTSCLDLAPPGYQEWRLGSQSDTWRTFITQLSTGNPKLSSPGIGLPLESALTGPLPYDFLPTDIPLRFVGPGVIADRLQSYPATFNVPPRRELEKALRHFKHILDKAGGKGGHQKWTGPDQRAFILPTRDPVSTGVFKTFLDHVGINKDTYVRQVRPNL